MHFALQPNIELKYISKFKLYNSYIEKYTIIYGNIFLNINPFFKNFKLVFNRIKIETFSNIVK